MSAEAEILLIADVDDQQCGRFNVAIVRADNELIHGFVESFDELMQLKRFHHVQHWLVGLGDAQDRMLAMADRYKFINLDFENCEPSFADTAIYGRQHGLKNDLPRLDYFLHGGGHSVCSRCGD